jgi:hypothetical protein
LTKAHVKEKPKVFTRVLSLNLGFDQSTCLKEKPEVFTRALSLNLGFDQST